MLDSAIKFKIIPLNMAWTWHQADPWRTVTKNSMKSGNEARIRHLTKIKVSGLNDINFLFWGWSYTAGYCMFSLSKNETIIYIKIFKYSRIQGCP